MNWLQEMLEGPTSASTELEMLPCGHEGKAGEALCYCCMHHMQQEMQVFKRAYVYPSDNALEMLTRLGISRTGIWRALRRGWFTYRNAEIIISIDKGGFAELNDPYAFAQSQVRHIYKLWGLEATPLAINAIPDMVQEALLKCWELRFRHGVKSWPAFYSTVIRRKVQDLLPRELKYQLFE